MTRHKKASCLERLSFSWSLWSVQSSWSVGMLRLFSKGLIFLSNLPSPTTSVAIPITFHSFFTKVFYVLFGSSGLWVMQAQYPLCQSGCSSLISYPRSISNQTADLIYLFYELDLLLAVFLFHVHGHSTTSFDCTSIMVGFGSLKGRSSRDLLEEDFWLRILSGVNLLIRPTTIIVITLWAMLFFRGNWANTARLLQWQSWRQFVFAGLNTAVNHQKSCADLETRRAG